MSILYKHWCDNGCGKKVVCLEWDKKFGTRKKIFNCPICLTKYVTEKTNGKKLIKTQDYFGEDYNKKKR